MGIIRTIKAQRFKLTTSSSRMRGSLSPDLFQKYDELAFWNDTSGSKASVIAPKPNAPQESSPDGSQQQT